MEQSQSGAGDLAGLRVLVVEDEYYLADDIARTLEESGATIVGPVGTLAEADRVIAGGGFDRAVIDMNLRGEMAYAVADRLLSEGIPFVIATGYNSVSMPERLSDLPRIEKPFRGERLVALLSGLTKR